MVRVMLWLGMLSLCFILEVSVAAPVGGTNVDIVQQLRDIQKQLGEMHAEMKDLSGRVEKIEGLIPKSRRPQKVTVNLQGAPRLGDAGATIGIVEFSDYQCPYCRRFHTETFPRLQKAYIDTGKVAFAVKNFPLDFHPAARGAALTVNCARQQNIKAFWDIQGQLFLNQNHLGRALYDRLIKRYGLDGDEFTKCLADTKQQDAIAKDLSYAERLGVQGTPTFFIGRLEGDRLVDAVRLVGAQPYSAFVQILNSVHKADGPEKM